MANELRDGIGGSDAEVRDDDQPEAKDVIAVDILDSGDVLVYFKK